MRHAEKLGLIRLLDHRVLELVLGELAASPKVQLKNFGRRVAIDDFGVGYTSFRNLRKLGGDIVKIDGAALMLRDCGCDYVQC